MYVLEPKRFVDNIIEELRVRYGDANRVLAAVSGGVDSTTSAIIAYKALGDKVIPVFIDTGFMRMYEGVKVKEMLRNLIPLEVVDMSEVFYRRIEGLSDAEVKRKVFREVFYQVVSDIAREFRCEYVVQGTIAADVVETLGGIKTQHNVLTDEFMGRYGFKVIEPIRDLYKDEVRAVAKYLGIPELIVNRQPFPGPGLLVRTVGLFTREKLDVVVKATEIVEEVLGGHGISQYFPAAWEYEVLEEGKVCSDVCIPYKMFKVKATGIKSGGRVYEPIALVEGIEGLNYYTVYRYFSEIGVSHVIVQITDRGVGKYFVSVRAVITEDFMTASVASIGVELLRELASKLAVIDGVRAVGYDVTPKPPATIEYE